MNEQKVFPFRAHVARGATGGTRSERAGWLTQQEVETLFADALWAGRGSQLEVSVPAMTSDAGVTWIRQRFDRLRNRGIGVRVHRDAAWHFREMRSS